MKKIIVASVIALSMTAGMALVAGSADAAGQKKVAFVHNGHVICVSAAAAKAHTDHGDQPAKGCLRIIKK